MESWDNEPSSKNNTPQKADVVVKEKSLLKVLFETEVKSTEEQRHAMVKRAINTIICQRALTLKEQIRKEMSLVKAEESLKEQLEKLRINRNVLLSLREQLSESSGSSLKIKTSMSTIMRSISESMETVNEIKHRIAGLKICWEYFSQNYKDVVFEAVGKNYFGYNDQEAGDVYVQWTDFIPALKLEQDKGAQVHRISYFE